MTLSVSLLAELNGLGVQVSQKYFENVILFSVTLYGILL